MLKIQFLNGGLANQAFQYIFARYYELSHPGEIMYLDDSYFALNTVHNGYELEKVFGIKAHMLSEAFDKDVWEYMLEEKKKGKSIPQIILESGEDICMVAETDNKTFNPFNGKILVPNDMSDSDNMQIMPGNVYYHGYWIKKNWFEVYKNIFLKEFSFPPIQDDKNKSLLNEIETTNSLSIHIRRRDYVSIGWSWETETFRSMVDIFIRDASNDWTLFVFSDDIDWCRENSEAMGFGKFNKTVYVEGNTDGRNYIDMQLMSRCKGMMMSNSAFCYLAALLNTDKIASLNITDRKL